MLKIIVLGFILSHAFPEFLEKKKKCSLRTSYTSDSGSCGYWEFKLLFRSNSFRLRPHTVAYIRRFCLFFIKISILTLIDSSAFVLKRKPIISQMDRAPATATVNSGSIPGLVKSNNRKIDIFRFLAECSAIKWDSVKPPPCVVGR